MSVWTWNASDTVPLYRLEFYNGTTLVGTIYRPNIVQLSIQRYLMTDKPTMGQANSGELDATLFKPSFTIPRMAKVKVVAAWVKGEQTINYTMGVFYIDTRAEDTANNTLNIHCYDAMLMTEQACPSYGTDIDVVSAIASLIGVDLDASVTASIVNAYAVPQEMTDDSARQALKAIGAAYGGSFFISREGKLAFAGFRIPTETFYLVDQDGDAITFGGDRIIV